VSRPRDWSALGEVTDPVPGDPDAVIGLSAQFSQTARAIAETADLLRGCAAAEGWQARGAGGFRARSATVASLVDAAFDRYEAAARALGDYAPALRECQRRADAALAAARAGPREWLPAAHRDLAEAVADRDAAARVATARIGHSIGHDGVRDTWKDRLCALVARIVSTAGAISFAAGSAALFLAWIPIIGPALAAGFSAVSTWAAVVALTGHLFLLVEGECDMRTLALDIVGLATAGVTRAYASLSAESAVTARALARSREAARLRMLDPGLDRRAVYRAVNRATGGPAGRAGRAAGRYPRAAGPPGSAAVPGSFLEPRAAVLRAVTGYRADVAEAVSASRSLVPERAAGDTPGARSRLWRAGPGGGRSSPPGPGGSSVDPLALALAAAGERDLAIDLAAAARIRPDLAADPTIEAHLARARGRGVIALGGWTGGVVLGGLDAAGRVEVAFRPHPTPTDGPAQRHDALAHPVPACPVPACPVPACPVPVRPAPPPPVGGPTPRYPEPGGPMAGYPVPGYPGLLARSAP
jgi:hypothetical protein